MVDFPKIILKYRAKKRALAFEGRTLEIRLEFRDLNKASEDLFEPILPPVISVSVKVSCRRPLRTCPRRTTLSTSQKN